MESEKVKEIKARLQEVIEYCARELEKDLFQKSLTLINELESENERLNKSIKNIQKGFDNGEFISKDSLITVLKRFVEVLKQEANFLFEGGGDKKGIEIVSVQRIDETLKEFTNEQKM